MHRYSSSGGSVGNQGSVGGSRETRGSDSSFTSSSTFGPSSRRAGQLVSYKLKCEKEALSARFGPPDFYPPALNCPEEVLNRDSCVNGYKELIDGIEEASEAKLSLTSQSYNTLWNKPNINRFKEAIRKRLRVLNNALIRKRKAGQVYGLALSGPLLAKPGLFPELRTCGEDFRKKWIEDLSQRKRLRSLAEHVPHGYRRRALLEALIKHDVPLLRATWFVKIMYLNQVRPMSIGMSAGGPDKSQPKRVELWTKDILDYAQTVLDEFCQAGSSRQLSMSLVETGTQGGDSGQGIVDAGEMKLQAKWRYVVRLAQWHHSEGLIHRTQLVDWVLKQLQEKESMEALELLLPVILKLIDDISLSQTHVRVLVDIALHWLQELCPSGVLSNVMDRPHLLYSAISLTELLRSLLLVVPDTFVALDCFPLPSCVCPVPTGGDLSPFPVSMGGRRKDPSHLNPSSDYGEVGKETAKEVGGHEKITNSFNVKSLSHRELIVVDVVDGIQKRSASLAKAVNPGLLRNNEGKVVQGLDKALIGGDIHGACNCVFDEDFCSSEQLPDEWQADVIAGYGRTPSLLSNVNSSELFAIRFLCEWAVCDFRDSRGAPSTSDRKASIGDMSRVYMTVSVLHLRKEELDGKEKVDSNPSIRGVTRSRRGKLDGYVPIRQLGPDFCASPGPLHDLLVAWLDQHELRKGECYERLQLLLSELVYKGLFWPDAYVRQLLCSGVLERNETAADISRAARHKLLLRHLPGPPQFEGSVDSSLHEAAHLFQNERHLALHGFNLKKVKFGVANLGLGPVAQQPDDGIIWTDDWGNTGTDHRFGFGTPESRSLGVNKTKKPKVKLFELMQSIASCFHFPDGWVRQSRTISEIKSLSTLKRQAVSPGNSTDKREATPGCEECTKSKRSKIHDGKAWSAQAFMPAPLEEDETWWLRKGLKALNAVKVEPPLKPPAKQITRGRPKTVRKTQSLAQLAAARVEGSQGASSSHLCDIKVNCLYHGCPPEGGSTSQGKDRRKKPFGNDVRAIRSAIRDLRLNEKRSISRWLDNVVRSLLNGVGNGSTNAHNNMGLGVLTSMTSTGVDGETGAQWKMNEEHLSTMVYLLDVAHDFRTLVQLLLWLLPMAQTPPGTTPGHGSRSFSTLTLNRENSICEVGETSVLSYLRRYEGVLAAMDLLPQALLAGMERAANLMAVVPGGRAACSALLAYVRDLLRKYGGLEKVQMWEKNWKATCDQRLGAELEALKAGDGEGGFGLVGLSSSAGGGDERDDPMPQRLTGRLARVGANMKDIINRGMSEAVAQMVAKERDLATTGGLREGVADRSEEGLQASQRVVVGVMDAIRQNGNGALQGDSALVATAITFVVGSAGAATANVFETLGSSNLTGTGASGVGSYMKCARRVLQMHTLCLRLLKDALGDRHSRMVEVALVSEANNLVMQAMQHPPGRAPRTQFHLSPEAPENPALGNDFGVGSNPLGRADISAAAAASLVVSVVVQGITSLERMVTVIKMKEILETLQISKTTNSSGISRSTTGSSNLKDHVAEAHMYWARVLIGDCRMVASGLVADLLGEANVLGLARMQRSMPLTVVFPPAYALFAAALRRQTPAYTNSTVREDPVLLTAINAVNEIVAHEPFRDVCFRDTRALYLLLSSDSGESEYAAMLDIQEQDVFSKVVSMVPLRARLFLHSLLDRGLPASLLQNAETWGQGRVNAKNRFANEPRQIEQLVQVLDDLQPATYQWQWVELRLLLNEQVFIEKLEGQNMSALQAVQAAAAGSDTRQLSECEKTFTEVVLTRLLVRPDAAALYSEAVHSLGRALEEYLILQVKWILEGNDMLLGRKSLRQLLDNIASRQRFFIGTRRIKMWGWQSGRHRGDIGSSLGIGEKKKSEIASPEEGEVAEDGTDFRKEGGQHTNGFEQEALYSQQFATEKALADLVLPCLARSSNDTCSSFAFDLIKQMSHLEQQITLLARSGARPVVVSTTGTEALVGKGTGLRRGVRPGLDGGSPGIGRKFMGLTPDSPPVSAAALQTSMWLRLQFLLPLLPIIHTDREQTARNMRQTLAPVLLRLLGTRVVQEAVESLHPVSARDLQRNAEALSATAPAAGEGLFDRLLSVLHALLSTTWAVWLKPRSTAKGPSKPLREVPPFDREAAERMQAEMEHMELPRSVRARLQAAMPLLQISPSLSISAGIPQVSSSALTVIDAGGSSSLSPPFCPVGTSQKPSFSIENDLGKSKPTFLPEPEVEIDPWTLMEDGVGMGVGVASGEVGNSKACSWLKGAVRVRRNDLTYVGVVQDDS